MGAVLCSSTTGTDRVCEAGGSSQLSSGFFHWLRACRPDVLCYRAQEKTEGSPFPLHSPCSPQGRLSGYIQTQSPNCGFSITVSSPAHFVNWKPRTNPIAFQIGLLSTAIKKKSQMPHCQSAWPLHNCELHSYINVTNAIISISSCHRSGSESLLFDHLFFDQNSLLEKQKKIKVRKFALIRTYFA